MNNNSLDTILEEIERRSKQRVDAVRGEEKEKTDSIKKDFEERKNRYLEDVKKDAERQGELRKRELITQARMENKKKILNRKREQIEAVFDDAIEKIDKLDKNGYTDFMSVMLAEAVATGDEKILPAAGKKIFTPADIKKLNKANGWELDIGPDTDRIEKGFILKGENFETVVDYFAIRDFIKQEYEEKVIKDMITGEDGNSGSKK